MNQFAVQIDMADGVTHHMFGHGEQAYVTALELRDLWRYQDPTLAYPISVNGVPLVLLFGDIRDVRVMVEGGR